MPLEKKWFFEFFLLFLVFFNLLLSLANLTSNFFYFSLLSILPFFLTSIILLLFFPRSDHLLLPLTYYLFSVGLTEIARLNFNLATRQLIWLNLSFLLALTLFFLKSTSRLKNYSYLFGFLGLALLFLPVLLGYEAGGARLWLKIGSLSFQPAELGRLFLIIFFASYLEKNAELLSQGTVKIWRWWLPHPKHLGPLLFLTSLALIFLIYLKDIGFSVLFFFLFLLLLYGSTGRFFYLFTGNLLFLIGSFLVYLNFAHVQARIKIFLNPWQDIEGRGYQLVQSFFGMAEGRMVGPGLTKGFPQLIPAAATDFIFSAIKEELGFLGALTVIISLMLLYYRLIRISFLASEGFPKILLAGLAYGLAIQSFVILGGLMGLLPLTGVTLPWVSYGGSSLLVQVFSLFLALKISGEVIEQ